VLVPYSAEAVEEVEEGAEAERQWQGARNQKLLVEGQLYMLVALKEVDGRELGCLKRKSASLGLPEPIGSRRGFGE
jgi:hypothetical protein